MSKQVRLAALVLVTICSVMIGLLSIQRAQAQNGQEVGVALNGANALELIGKIDQNGLDFTGYGYLTYISGVPDAEMFSDPINRSEATAHFTFASTGTASARSVLQTIFVLNGTGQTTIYYTDTPAGSFDDPTTFSSGTAIATSSERWQNIINVQAPNTAIDTTISTLTESSATPFTLGSGVYQLGHQNLVMRMTYTGQGTRTDSLLPRSSIILAGYGVVGGG